MTCFYRKKKKKSWKKKFWKKNQNGTQKKHVFQTCQFSIYFCENYGLVLGLVELIDAKGIDMAQPTWLWDCPALAQNQFTL